MPLHYHPLPLLTSTERQENISHYQSLKASPEKAVKQENKRIAALIGGLSISVILQILVWTGVIFGLLPLLPLSATALILTQLFVGLSLGNCFLLLDAGLLLAHGIIPDSLGIKQRIQSFFNINLDLYDLKSSLQTKKESLKKIQGYKAEIKKIEEASSEEELLLKIFQGKEHMVKQIKWMLHPNNPFIAFIKTLLALEEKDPLETLFAYIPDLSEAQQKSLKVYFKEAFPTKEELTFSPSTEVRRAFYPDLQKALQERASHWYKEQKSELRKGFHSASNQTFEEWKNNLKETSGIATLNLSLGLDHYNDSIKTYKDAKGENIQYQQYRAQVNPFKMLHKAIKNKSSVIVSYIWPRGDESTARAQEETMRASFTDLQKKGIDSNNACNAIESSLQKLSEVPKDNKDLTVYIRSCLLKPRITAAITELRNIASTHIH